MGHAALAWPDPALVGEIVVAQTDATGLSVIAGGESEKVPGGSFSLVDHTCKRVTEAAFRGKFLLVFFGYTFCPDICPTTLQVIAEAMDLLGPKVDRVQPVFITVDPERDTSEMLAEYVAAFHPCIVGSPAAPLISRMPRMPSVLLMGRAPPSTAST